MAGFDDRMDPQSQLLLQPARYCALPSCRSLVLRRPLAGAPLPAAAPVSHGDFAFCPPAAYSYRDTTWLSFDDLMEHKAQLLRNFITRHNPDEEDPELEDGVHPDWLLVERVIAHKGNAKVGQLRCRRGVPAGRLHKGDVQLRQGCRQSAAFNEVGSHRIARVPAFGASWRLLVAVWVLCPQVPFRLVTPASTCLVVDCFDIAVSCQLCHLLVIIPG